MITFSNDSFTITVNVGVNPVEHWLVTVDEMFEALQNQNAEMRSEQNYYYMIDLMRQMMPDVNTAKNMIPTK